MYYLKNNIGNIVRGLRRVLLLGLVFLCIILIYREFNKAKESYTKEKRQHTLHSAKWGAETEKLARELDMPIFFSIKDKFTKEAKNDDFVKRNFVYTELDPNLYPADHIALKALHCNIGEDIDITCGVLSSKMYPILTTSNTLFYPDGKRPPIKSMLRGIVSVYHENYNRFLKLSKNFYLLNDIPSKYQINELKEDTAKLSFMLDFGYHEKFKAAQLSESARLIFRNCIVGQYSSTIKRMKVIAYKEIVSKAKQPEKLRFYERAFYNRALADYILIFKDTKNLPILEKYTEEILSCQLEDGSFLLSGEASALKNTMSFTMLSYSYKITKKEKYLVAMKKFASFIEKELKESSGLKADFNKGGLSGAKGYVYLSRGLLNAYIVSLDKQYLNLNMQVLERLDKNYNKLNEMPMELAKESPLAKYINLCSVEDTEYTSSIGVLLQTYKDMQTLKVSDNIDIRIKSILDSTLNFPCGDIDFDFSLRIAKYTNPLITVNTLQKVAAHKEEITFKRNKF